MDTPPPLGWGEVVSPSATHPRPFDRAILCSACGQVACRAQLMRAEDGWRFIFSGIEAGSGPDGTIVDDEEAARLSKGFAAPVTYARVHKARLYDDAGFCSTCKKAYCDEHWNVSSSGGGTCPKGHFKSLDPHWSPPDPGSHPDAVVAALPQHQHEGGPALHVGDLVLTPVDAHIVNPTPEADRKYQGQFEGAQRRPELTHELIVHESYTVEEGWHVTSALVRGPSGGAEWVEGWHQTGPGGQTLDPDEVWAYTVDHQGGNGYSEEAAFAWIAPEHVQEAILQIAALVVQRKPFGGTDAGTPASPPRVPKVETAGPETEDATHEEDVEVNPQEPFPYDVAQVLSWRLLSELVRRHPDRLWLRSTYPFDFYDFLTAVPLERPHELLLEVNRLGTHAQIWLTGGGEKVVDWARVYRNEPNTFREEVVSAHAWLVERERELGLEPPRGGLPASTPPSLAIRFVAQFLAMQLGSRKPWFARSGSGAESAIPGLAEWTRAQPEHAAHAGVWYLGNDGLHGQPSLALTPDGSVWFADGRTASLPSLHRSKASISELVVRVTGSLLP